MRVYSTPAVRDALTTKYPLMNMLETFCGVDWRPLSGDGPTPLEDTTLADVANKKLPKHVEDLVADRDAWEVRI